MLASGIRRWLWESPRGPSPEPAAVLTLAMEVVMRLADRLLRNPKRPVILREGAGRAVGR